MDMSSRDSSHIVVSTVPRLLILSVAGLFLCAGRLYSAEPNAYLQATSAAKIHATDPAGWVATDLKIVSAPGDGNTWSGGNVLVRAFTNPQYYNLSDAGKKYQNLWPGAVWVTTGNELPAWYRDPVNGVTAGNVSLKTVQIHGLPTSSLHQYNAIVEILVDPSKLIRPTRDPNVAAQPTVLPTGPFAPKPANLSQADYDAYKAWYAATITSSYGASNPDNRYPWTQLGYTYRWGEDQANLPSIQGLSEFVVLGTRSGVTSPLETFAVYSLQSYLYRVGTDGDGVGDFNVTGSLDTLWSGTKFQPGGSSITISRGGVVRGGEGIYLSSGGYTLINNGSIIGPTARKYYGDGPAGASVYFRDGGTLINGAGGVMEGDDIAIQGSAAGQGVRVTTYGYLAGIGHAMKTGAGNDSLIAENGGIVRGTVALGTGTDQIRFGAGSTWHTMLDRTGGTASTLQAAVISLQEGSTVTPLLTGTGLLPSSSSYALTQGSISGFFSFLTDQYPLFDFALNNSGGSLNLVVTRVPYGDAVTAYDHGLAPLAEELYRQLGTASGDMAVVLSTIDSMGGNRAFVGALRQLGPGLNTVVPRISFATDRARLGRLQQRAKTLEGERERPVRYASLPAYNDAGPVPCRSTGDGWKGFVVAAGDWGHQDSEGVLPGFSYDGWSTQAGLERNVSSSLSVGFALGGAQTSARSKDVGSSSLAMDSITASLFASMASGFLHTDLIFGYGYTRYDSRRRILFGGINRTASGSFDGHQLSALVSSGHRFTPGPALYVEPVAGVYVSGLFQGGYAESGAGAANLHVYGSDDWSVRSIIGPRIGTRLDTGNGVVELLLSAFWSHEFNDTLYGVTSSFSGNGDSFRIDGIRYDRDSADVSCRLQYQLLNNGTISAEYAVSAAPASMEHSARLELTWYF